MIDTFPDSWRGALGAEFESAYWKELEGFVAQERKGHEVFPPADEVFTAYALTPYDAVKVLVLGQDPYHDVGQAHGLSFSVKPGVAVPPSLANMYKELKADLGLTPPKHGNLVPWAKQGVMMLNAVLTVRAHTPNSHKDRGWEKFTDATISALSRRSDPLVFVLWGKYAQKKSRLIDAKRHRVLEGAHPSPLSAKAGFFGSRPYSQVNDALKAMGKSPVDWSLPDL